MQNWTEPELVMNPDEADHAKARELKGGMHAEFYNMSAFPYAGQWLGLVTVFRRTGPPPVKGPGQGGDHGPIDVQLVHSRDGRQWQRWSFLPPVGELSMSETDLAAWPDGRVIALIRAEWFDTPKDRLPAEANGNGTKRDGYGYFLYQATSTNGGRDWNTPEPLPVWGHPPFLLQLRSGNLLMVYGHRRPPGNGES